ncbi:hypothetical protein [Actinoplanes sp. NPDC089786]|uniref:hypothetical protein n=1 Tax=Actinoplanes sp. NPDC089786 TaxID=3155185 RepID=UPI00343AF15E
MSDPPYAWGPPASSWQLGLRATRPGHHVELYAAVRRTGEAILPAGTLTLQTRTSDGAITEDGSGPRPTTALPLAETVTEIAGWRLPPDDGATYRATFIVPDGGPALESGWVSAAESPGTS